MNWKIIIELVSQLLKGDERFSRALRQKKVSTSTALLLRARKVALSNEVIIGLMLLTLSNIRTASERLDTISPRLERISDRIAKVEGRLGLAADVTHLAETNDVATHASVSVPKTFSFVRKNQPEN